MKYEYEIHYRTKGISDSEWFMYGIRYYNEREAKDDFKNYQQACLTHEFRLMRRKIGEWEEVKE